MSFHAWTKDLSNEWFQGERDENLVKEGRGVFIDELGNITIGNWEKNTLQGRAVVIERSEIAKGKFKDG